MQVFNAILQTPDGKQESLLLGAGANNHIMELKLQEGNNFSINFESNTKLDFISQRLSREEVLENDRLIELIAETCHRNNKLYCESIDDNSQVDWKDAPDWQKNSTKLGVVELLKRPDITSEALHEEWKKDKEAGGWKYGKVKDFAKKEHPCMVPYNDLPEEQQKKDALFSATVNEFFKDNYKES